ncbi:hypothetical protein D3C71_1628290 [compost metagenome]
MLAEPKALPAIDWVAATMSANAGSESTRRIPIPPPPAAALTNSGKPTACAASARPVASSGVKRALPGSTGTPATFAISRARSLSPMSRMVCGAGPTQVIPAALTALANAAFSARKP